MALNKATVLEIKNIKPDQYIGQTLDWIETKIVNWMTVLRSSPKTQHKLTNKLGAAIGRHRR